jgi:hypothetical protein
VQRQKPSPYEALIREATSAPEDKLALLESLMREKVFHSTLDWQSASLLADGARRAFDLYRSAPTYFDGIEIHQRARFRLARLEDRLESARTSSTPAKLADLELRVRLARDSERSAREAIPRLAAFHGL